MSEIIIDGCNVAECSRFDKETGYCKSGFKPEQEPYCIEFTCDFKRCKRLEEDNKKLKQWYKEEIASNDKLKSFLNWLKNQQYYLESITYDEMMIIVDEIKKLKLENDKYLTKKLCS